MHQLPRRPFVDERRAQSVEGERGSLTINTATGIRARLPAARAARARSDGQRGDTAIAEEAATFAAANATRGEHEIESGAAQPPHRRRSAYHEQPPCCLRQHTTGSALTSIYDGREAGSVY